MRAILVGDPYLYAFLPSESTTQRTRAHRNNGADPGLLVELGYCRQEDTPDVLGLA